MEQTDSEGDRHPPKQNTNPMPCHWDQGSEGEEGTWGSGYLARGPALDWGVMGKLPWK